MTKSQWEVTDELKQKMALMDNPALDPADVEEADHDDSK